MYKMRCNKSDSHCLFNIYPVVFVATFGFTSSILTSIKYEQHWTSVDNN